MTRPKVNPEHRQRTASACDSCKRRKQKCDGHQPCNTCAKKQLTCTYTAESTQGAPSLSNDAARTRLRNAKRSQNDEYDTAPNPTGHHFPHDTSSTGNATEAFNLIPSSYGATMEMKPQPDYTSSAGDEEVDNHTMTRMLKDGTGRLTYLGDASTLSFLQLLRMIVETVAGPSPFSTDPKRHTIAEAKMSLAPTSPLTQMLPEKQIAITLVESFFTNTYGLMEVFSESAFLEALDHCYSDPLTTNHIYLCHLNLVLAIGLAFVTPDSGSPEATIIDSLRSKSPDQSELFYLNAKSLVSLEELENGDVWSIQALLLMAMYLLTKSLRNPAFSYIGMAVRTAYALGLHRQETLAVFSDMEQNTRNRIWRSLFIMDRFIAASLGRPVAIAEEECSGDVFDPQTNSFSTSFKLGSGQLCTAGMEAAVRSCHVVGIILRKVYLKRRISMRLAQELANECKKWPQSLSPALHWRQASPDDRRQAIAILHSNLIYCHSVILLSRPFFLYLVSAEVRKTHFGSNEQASDRSQQRMLEFSEACVIASMHTVALVQQAYQGCYLPKLNAFATFVLFAAALVILANDFARPSTNELSKQCIANSITIMSYCGEMDPQAARATHVLIEFRDVVNKRQQAEAFQHVVSNEAPAVSNANLAYTSQDSGLAPIPPLPGATSAYKGDGAATVPSNPFEEASANTVPSLPTDDSFSGLLDLTNTVLPDYSDPGSSLDESIDFESLWGGWPPTSSDTQLDTLSPDQNMASSYPEASAAPITALEYGMNAISGGDAVAGTSLFEHTRY